jgi:hypothetical protein
LLPAVALSQSRTAIGGSNVVTRDGDLVGRIGNPSYGCVIHLVGRIGNPSCRGRARLGETRAMLMVCRFCGERPCKRKTLGSRTSFPCARVQNRFRVQNPNQQVASISARLPEPIQSRGLFNSAEFSKYRMRRALPNDRNHRSPIPFIEFAAAGHPWAGLQPAPPNAAAPA